MKKVIITGALIGFLAGVVLTFLNPSLLITAFKFESVSRQVQGLPQYGYSSGSTLASSVVVIPLLFGLFGSLIGFATFRVINRK